MRWLSVLGLVFVVSACGADGEPVMPTMNGTIGIGSGGVYTSANVGLRKGPVTISVGTGCRMMTC